MRGLFIDMLEARDLQLPAELRLPSGDEVSQFCFDACTRWTRSDLRILISFII